jgi:hypothetical protein
MLSKLSKASIDVLRPCDITLLDRGHRRRRAHLEILFLDQERVEGLVDRLVVQILHRPEVRLDQLQVSGFGEERHRSGVVHPRRQHQQQVVQQQRLVVQVELYRLVVELDVGNFGDDVLEVALAPRLGRVRHHGQHGVVVLLVLVVQEDQFGPEVGLLRRSQHFGDVNARPEQLQVFAHLRRLVFRVEDRQFGEHAHVGALQTQRRLQQPDQLLEVAAVLVVVDEVLELVGVDHDVHAAHLRQAELLGVDAREAHLLPGARAVGLAGAVDGSLPKIYVLLKTQRKFQHSAHLELLQMDQRDRQPSEIRDVVVEQLGRVVHFIVETPVSDFLYVCVVGTADELL